MSHQQINVLIAEDHEESRRLIERALTSYFGDKNLCIFKTDKLSEALSLGRIRGPMDIGLIDLELSDAKPVETLKVLRNLAQKVIVMSGAPSGEGRRDAKSSGAWEYVEKPVMIEFLVEKIASILDNKLPGTGFGAVQLRAQADLQQRASAHPTVPISRWVKTAAMMVTIFVPIMATAIGYVAGGWRSAQAQGAAKQALVDQLTSIDRNISELKDGKTKQEATLLQLQIDVAKIVARNTPLSGN